VWRLLARECGDVLLLRRRQRAQGGNERVGFGKNRALGGIDRQIIGRDHDGRGRKAQHRGANDTEQMPIGVTHQNW
jgi:hypothetical protein